MLPVLSILSKTLQAGSVHYGQLQPAIDRTFTQLQSLAESKEPIESLKKDLAPETGRLKLVATVVDSDHPQPTEDDAAERVTGDDDGLRSQIRKATGNGIVLTDQVEGQLRRMIDTYVDCLTKNIENRFTEGLQILNAFSVLDPRLMPAKGTLEFSTYGEQKIELLGQHFFSDEPVKCEQLLDEWKLFKHQVSRWKSDVHDVRTATTVWCLKRLLSVKSSLQYEILSYIAEIALATPVSKAWPERGASAIKRIKTRLCSSLKMDMLDSLLHVAINGPAVNSPEVGLLVEKAVEKFLGKKRRVKGKMEPTPLKVKSKPIMVDLDPSRHMSYLLMRLLESWGWMSTQLRGQKSGDLLGERDSNATPAITYYLTTNCTKKSNLHQEVQTQLR